MACNSSGSSILRSSSSEEDVQIVMDQRKRKRMLSNRESARRSRQRKQKHLDDLMSQIGQLRKENSEILSSMSVTTQLYLNIEAENSILRAQMTELSHRLESLNEIINSVNLCNGIFGAEDGISSDGTDDFLMMNPWTSSFALNQPILDMVMY